jgi:hypothetical protein
MPIGKSNSSRTPTAHRSSHNRTLSKAVWTPAPHVPIHLSIFFNDEIMGEKKQIKINGADFSDTHVNWLRRPEPNLGRVFSDKNTEIERSDEYTPSGYIVNQMLSAKIITIDHFINSILNALYFEYDIQFKLDKESYDKIRIAINLDDSIRELPDVSITGYEISKMHPYNTKRINAPHALFLKRDETYKPRMSIFNKIGTSLTRNFFTINGPIGTPGPDVDFTNIYKSKNEGGRRTHRKKQRHSKSKRIRKR